MIVHLFESTLFLAVALLVAQTPRLAARTRYAVVFAALVKFAIPSAIVPRILALFGIDLARMPKGTILIDALGPLTATSLPAASAPSRLPMILIAVWLAVAVALLARALLRGRTAVRRALAEGREANAGELAALERACGRTGLAHAVRLVSSPSMATPATAGILHPIIIIPAATALTVHELETILTHECAHIGRRDNLLGLIESVAGCALWFHPLVWIARRILDAAREEACDAIVLASGDSGTYINALRKVCEAVVGPRVAAVSCIVSNTIHERMEAIMTLGTRRLLSHRAVIAVVLALLTATTLGIGVARALPRTRTASDSPRVDVTLSRDAGGIYLFEIAVRDRATDDLITSASLKAHAEEPATMDASNPEVHIRAIAHQDGTADVETRFMGGSPIVTKIEMKSAATSGSKSDSISGDSPLRVGGDVKPPVVINRVEPVYPDQAKKSRISGIVIVEVIVDHTGVVKDARILKPLPYGLDQAALDAVKQWTFRPASLNGNAVDAFFNLTINFRSSEPMSLDLKDADIRDVMKTFAQLTNLEIVADDDVHGTVTVTLRDTPWQEALDRILDDANLRSERTGNTIRVHRK